MVIGQSKNALALVGAIKESVKLPESPIKATFLEQFADIAMDLLNDQYGNDAVQAFIFLAGDLSHAVRDYVLDNFIDFASQGFLKR